MSEKEVVAAVRAAGLPVAHIAWPKDSAPKLPFCVFYIYGDAVVFADNSRYADHYQWCVELYQRQNDSESEKKLEAELKSAFGTFKKSEAWVESEGCMQTTYVFDQY